MSDIFYKSELRKNSSGLYEVGLYMPAVESRWYWLTVDAKTLPKAKRLEAGAIKTLLLDAHDRLANKSHEIELLRARVMEAIP